MKRRAFLKALGLGLVSPAFFKSALADKEFVDLRAAHMAEICKVFGFPSFAIGNCEATRLHNRAALLSAGWTQTDGGAL